MLDHELEPARTSLNQLEPQNACRCGSHLRSIACATAQLAPLIHVRLAAARCLAERLGIYAWSSLHIAPRPYGPPLHLVGERPLLEVDGELHRVKSLLLTTDAIQFQFLQVTTLSIPNSGSTMQMQVVRARYILDLHPLTPNT